MAPRSSRYLPQGGSARRYLDRKTGETISRRQFLNRTRHMTIEKYAKKRLAQHISSHMDRYNSLVRLFKEHWAKVHNVKVSQVRVRGDSPSAKRFKEIMSTLKKRQLSHGARSPLGKALVDLGRRQPEWRWMVGDTPRHVKSRLA